jgi:hypothetical protein
MRGMLKRIAVATMIAATLGVLALAPAMAKGGRGGNSGSAAATGTLTVDQASPHYGDTVTFSASVNGVPSNADLLVGVKCYREGVWVYQLQESLGSGFPLGGAGVSSDWSGGAGYCDADLFYFTYSGHTESGVVHVSQTGFDVAA